MTHSTLVSGPGPGFTFEVQDAVMLSHAAISVGDVLSVDTSVVSGLRFTTLRTPTAADITSTGALTRGIFCVALQAATAAGQSILCRFRGPVNALITGTPAIGAYVIPNTSKQLAVSSAAANNGNAVVGFMMETGVSGSLKQVVFDGIPLGAAVCLTNTT